jgi:V8-like Glu-specific endopeptidase
MQRRAWPVETGGWWARWRWLAGPLATVTAIVVVTWLLEAAVPAAVRSSPRRPRPELLVPSVPLAGAPFGGTPAVGALFALNGARLGLHICTASVVDSPAGDLLVTAAHCVQGYPVAGPVGLAFVPGYADGRARYGIWTVTRIFAGSPWRSAADPGHDVAFLAVAQPGGPARIETVTGAERLGTGQAHPGVVRVIGYPVDLDQPIACQNRVSTPISGRLEFDCDNYTAGTSGGPLLTDVNPATGDGTVIGVIGGYQQGGDTPDVSYATAFDQYVQALYEAATSGR